MKLIKPWVKISDSLYERHNYPTPECSYYADYAVISLRMTQWIGYIWTPENNKKEFIDPCYSKEEAMTAIDNLLIEAGWKLLKESMTVLL